MIGSDDWVKSPDDWVLFFADLAFVLNRNKIRVSSNRFLKKNI